MQLGAPQIAAVLIGCSIVLGVGIAASPRIQSNFSRTANTILLYILWLILVIGYAKHPARPFRLVAVALAIALVLRHLPQRNTIMEAQ